MGSAYHRGDLPRTQTDTAIRPGASPTVDLASAILKGMARLTMYERAGGDAFFDTLTRRFYDAVSAEPVLRPLYPEDPEAFEAARRHLRDFLIQFWGGPSTYSDERGHPRLRMRHAHLSIGQAERDAWVRHMTEAVRAGRLRPLDEQQMLTYFSGAATQLINQQEAAG